MFLGQLLALGVDDLHSLAVDGRERVLAPERRQRSLCLPALRDLSGIATQHVINTSIAQCRAIEHQGKLNQAFSVPQGAAA